MESPITTDSTARKKALITGITGQDGSYLTELLLEKGYEVHGMVRRSSGLNRSRIDHYQQDDPTPERGCRLVLHEGDMTDSRGLSRLVKIVRPDEVYNLAASSHTHISFDQPEYTGDIDGLGTVRLLEAIRTLGLRTRFYQASTSEMFEASSPPQYEETPFRPRSPYAAAKVYAHHMTVNYRAAHGLFACCGILFNHESPRRGENFVTRKVTRGVAQVLAGGQRLLLGSLEARRDWGHARDYVEAMWLMLQQDEPDDYVIGTGQSRSVLELVELAFGLVGLDWRDHVQTDSADVRAAGTNELCADPTRALRKLDWAPRTSFEQLVREMLEHDLAAAGLRPAAYLDQGRDISAQACAGDWCRSNHGDTEATENTRRGC